MTRHYFAYGSNMNPDRVERRRMGFAGHAPGALHDYQLAFNKRSKKYPGAASANVIAAPGQRVEGVIYELTHPDQIEVMDRFETYPVLYDRLVLPIRVATGFVDAWVYIANREHVQEGLMPARWYLAHLLMGEAHLSPAYFNQLAGTPCLPDSDVEPE